MKKITYNNSSKSFSFDLLDMLKKNYESMTPTQRNTNSGKFAKAKLDFELLRRKHKAEYDKLDAEMAKLAQECAKDQMYSAYGIRTAKNGNKYIATAAFRCSDINTANKIASELGYDKVKVFKSVSTGNGVVVDESEVKALNEHTAELRKLCGL